MSSHSLQHMLSIFYFSLTVNYLPDSYTITILQLRTTLYFKQIKLAAGICK